MKVKTESEVAQSCLTPSDNIPHYSDQLYSTFGHSLSVPQRLSILKMDRRMNNIRPTQKLGTPQN